MSEWLTVKEAMVIARVSYNGLRSYIKAGRLKASKPAGKVLIQREDLNAFLNSGRPK